MGYYMNQVEARFFIANKDKNKALKAIKKLKRASGDYCWVDRQYTKAKTLGQALQHWRWATEEDVYGNIHDISFTGEKMGDELILFQTIAPFVREDSYIEMHGEESAMWRWVFRNGKVTEKSPSVIWD
jgi:hypothetical protein